MGDKLQRHQVDIPEIEKLRPQPETSAPFNQVVIGGPGLQYVLSENRIKLMGGATTVAIPGNGVANRIRWDLIEMDKDGLLYRVAGAVQLTSVAEFTGAPGYPGSVALPTIGRNPLCYVRITEETDPEVDIQEDDISDIRSLVWPLFEAAVPGDFLTDAAVAVVGTVRKVFGADHRHPLNVDAVAPANLADVAASGSAAIYAKRDHAHKLPTISTRTLQNVLTAFTELSADPAGADIADLNLADATYELEEAGLDIVLTAAIDDGGGNVEYSAGQGTLRVVYDTVAAVARTVFTPSFPTWEVNNFGSVANTPAPTSAAGALAAAINAGSLIWRTSHPGPAADRISLPIEVTVFAGRVKFRWGATAAWALAGINVLLVKVTARASFRKMTP